MTPFERQVLRDLRAIALWSLVTALAVIGIPIVAVILALMGFSPAFTRRAGATSITVCGGRWQCQPHGREE